MKNETLIALLFWWFIVAMYLIGKLYFNVLDYFETEFTWFLFCCFVVGNIFVICSILEVLDKYWEDKK